MAIKDQFTEVFKQIGTLFTRVVDAVEDYLDLELNSSTTWRGKFVRKFSMKSASLYENGDIVQNVLDGTRYLITNLQSDLLLNESIYKTGELYKCNVSGEISFFSSGERSALNYKKSSSWVPLFSGEFFVLVPSRLEYIDRDPVPNLVDTLYMYVPNRLGIQNDYRITVNNPIIQHYRIKTVDNLSLEGIQVIQLETDKR
jgi:hypothetical protein